MITVRSNKAAFSWIKQPIGGPGEMLMLDPYPGFYWCSGNDGFTLYHEPGWWQRLHKWMFGRYWGRNQ